MDEIDIWRTAKLLVEKRGLYALYDALVRASELNATGDKAGAETWSRVHNAIEELQRTERLDGESLQ